MARIPLGAKTVLNLSTDLDPMFTEIYSGAFANFVFSNNNAGLGGAAADYGAAYRNLAVNGTTTAGLDLSVGGTRVATLNANTTEAALGTVGARSLYVFTNGVERVRFGSGSGTDATMVVAGSGRFAGPNVNNSALNGIQVGTASGFPQIIWVQAGAGVDSKTWDMYASATSLTLRALNDANSNASNVLIVTRAGMTLTDVQVGAAFRPSADNSFSCGAGAARWSVVYAGTGAINTSDAREKTPVHQLNADEIAAAKQIAREFGTYQFLSAVQEKGDAARMHAGTTVQRVIQIMESFGLDAMRYAFICYDEWDAQHDEEGNETSPAGNRYGFRTDELLMFVARGIAARQDELEARIAALEA